MRLGERVRALLEERERLLEQGHGGAVARLVHGEPGLAREQVGLAQPLSRVARDAAGLLAQGSLSALVALDAGEVGQLPQQVRLALGVGEGAVQVQALQVEVAGLLVLVPDACDEPQQAKGRGLGRLLGGVPPQALPRQSARLVVVAAQLGNEGAHVQAVRLALRVAERLVDLLRLVDQHGDVGVAGLAQRFLGAP